VGPIGQTNRLTRLVLTLAGVLLAVQITLGGWVSTNYAVLACTDFPTCQGSWWPDMAFAQGFQIWRELGMTADGAHVSFAALTAIHYAHRLMAYVVLLVLTVLVWRLGRFAHTRPVARTIGALAALQLATGLGNVVLDWPLIAALLHTGGAAALVISLTWAYCSSRADEGLTYGGEAAPGRRPTASMPNDASHSAQMTR
jgi:cytochrome c oxidase assembly protein subunit 15